MIPRPQSHIVRSFDEALEQMDALLLAMVDGLVAQLDLIGPALLKSPWRINLDEIVAACQANRDLFQQVEGSCSRLIALKQPMADDLRRVITAINVANDMERMGDLLKNIGRRVQSLVRAPEGLGFAELYLAVVGIQGLIQKALSTRKAEWALQAWSQEEQVDAAYEAVLTHLTRRMGQSPDDVTNCTHLLLLAKDLERMADHAVLIADSVVRQLTGKNLKHPANDNAPTTERLLLP
ncbi:MAG: phosphate signaling complex protein PhoU [Magnetococcales bacterium]|nr:phosphate signaling complex protein PhoU [Magnetococcales bacterium]